ncbi:DNA-processing protein DprA [Clostridium sp.]|jgi:DNA processing protein|uniref:DNA-processing protein DprA n=1 Tax=Clostridium sp. TaxID=1506 RepID=UPI003A5BC6D6
MEIYDLWFAHCRISDRLKIDILKNFQNTKDIWMNFIYYNKPIDIWENHNVCKKVSQKLKAAWKKDNLESMIEICDEKGIKSVNFNDELYPYMLKNYDDSPAILFYIGNLNKLSKNLNVGIVGSRKCSIYGKNAAEIISKEISKNGINVISGMARGIDSFAHRGCIDSGGYTCAVLGSGVDVVYPSENKKLYNDILLNGCVLSEVLPGSKPLAYNFPKRNRIISGLSDVIVVVEAAERSGALITAGTAAKQGKTVMAVPGSIFSYESKGTNKLIKDGAFPFTNLDDLFELLNLEYTLKPVKSKENIDILTLDQKRVYDVIGDTPMHIDDISRITNIDIKQLYELLFELQLKNRIICLSGNYYVKIHDKDSIIN